MQLQQRVLHQLQLLEMHLLKRLRLPSLCRDGRPHIPLVDLLDLGQPNPEIHQN